MMFLVHVLLVLPSLLLPALCFPSSPGTPKVQSSKPQPQPPPSPLPQIYARRPRTTTPDPFFPFIQIGITTLHSYHSTDSISPTYPYATAQLSSITLKAADLTSNPAEFDRITLLFTYNGVMHVALENYLPPPDYEDISRHLQHPLYGSWTRNPVARVPSTQPGMQQEVDWARVVASGTTLRVAFEILKSSPDVSEDLRRIDWKVVKVIMPNWEVVESLGLDFGWGEAVYAFEGKVWVGSETRVARAVPRMVGALGVM